MPPDSMKSVHIFDANCQRSVVAWEHPPILAAEVMATLSRQKGCRASTVHLRNRPGAFTLVELLVVIAIIAILATLLLPVLTKAKTQAVHTQCLNNEREQMVALSMYAGENQDHLPEGMDGSWC
jgi:prepilin-type N-terminal cleavage/methylation domain-containing protein